MRSDLDHIKFYLCGVFYFVEFKYESSNIEMMENLYSSHIKGR